MNQAEPIEGLTIVSPWFIHLFLFRILKIYLFQSIYIHTNGQHALQYANFTCSEIGDQFQRVGCDVERVGREVENIPHVVDVGTSLPDPTIASLLPIPDLDLEQKRDANLMNRGVGRSEKVGVKIYDIHVLIQENCGRSPSRGRETPEKWELFIIWYRIS